MNTTLYLIDKVGLSKEDVYVELWAGYGCENPGGEVFSNRLKAETQLKELNRFGERFAIYEIKLQIAA